MRHPGLRTLNQTVTPVGRSDDRGGQVRNGHLAGPPADGHHSRVSTIDREDVLAIMTSLIYLKADTILEYLGEDDEEEEDEA